MSLSWIDKPFIGSRKPYAWPGRRLSGALPIFLFFIVLLAGWGMMFPDKTGASSLSRPSYQRELSPAANRVLVLAQSLISKNKQRQALAEIEKFRRQHSHNAYVLVEFMAGNLQFSLEQYLQAVDSYRRTLEMAPAYLPARENLGMAHLSLKQYRQAAECFALAVSLARQSDQKRLDRLLEYAGTACLLTGDYAGALPFFTELVEQRSSYEPATLQALLKIYFSLHRYQAAEELLVTMISRFPENAEYWQWLGQARLAAGNYGPALAAYKVLVTLKVPESRDLKTVAGLYQLLGVPSSAARVLGQLESPPYFLSAREMGQLIALYLEAGDYHQALQYLKKKQDRYPAAENLLQQGEILYRAGHYQEAFTILEGIPLLPQKQGYQFLLAGYCAWYAGDLPAARSVFSRAAQYHAYRDRSLKLLKTVDGFLTQEEPLPPSS